MMYKRSTLNNDIRVVTHDMKERDSISLGFWISAGGRYENEKNKGVAHFLEHILFKGSRKYSCDAIKEKIEGVGGALNAFTTEEVTCYYAKIPARHLKQTFAILADMILHPKITAKDVAKERTVIVEEIKMYRDLPQFYVLELLDQMIWPKHPLGMNLAGTPDSVSRISARTLKDFHKVHYTTSNIVVAASGRVKHREIERLAMNAFAKINKTNKTDAHPVSCAVEQAHVRCLKKPIEQMHLALGMPGLDYHHKDKYVLNMLHVILGGNMSSRLFSEVREKRGLAYSISSSMKAMQDTGLFMIRAGVDNQKIVEAVDVILKEIRKFKRSGVRQDEFKRAKDYYIGQVLLGLEDTLDHMFWIGESTLSRDRTRTMNDIVRMINKIKPSDLKRLAASIFAENQFQLALIGPVTDSQEKQLQKMLGVGR